MNNLDKKQQLISVCCMKCGKKYDTKNKSVIGVWTGNCQICGKINVPVADAAHDFGIYSSEEIKKADEEQDLI